MTSGQYRLSIVVPTMNNPSGVVEVIQHYQNILAILPYSSELIVVDDGSTLENRLSLLQFIENNNFQIRVKLVLLSINSGQFIATRYGISNSEGQFVLTIDDDKSVDVNSITSLITKIEDNKLDFVVGFEVSNERRSLIRRIGSQITGIVGRRAYRTPRGHIFSSTVIFRSSAILEIAKSAHYPTKIGWFYQTSSLFDNHKVELKDIQSLRKSNYSLLKLLGVFLNLTKFIFANAQIAIARLSLVFVVVLFILTLIFTNLISDAPIGYMSLFLVSTGSVILSLLIFSQSSLISNKVSQSRECPISLKVIVRDVK